MSSASKALITEDEIIKLARLSSLELTKGEVKKYQTEVSTILTMIDKLKEIDTEGIEPTYQVSGNQNVMREDTIAKDIIQADKLLGLSARTKKSQIEVPKVL